MLYPNGMQGHDDLYEDFYAYNRQKEPSMMVKLDFFFKIVV